MLATMPRPASVGVSVLPSSVMSGAFLPLAGGWCQPVVRAVRGTPPGLTLFWAYGGTFLWTCATPPFTQVPGDGTDPPIRHTVSLAGAAAPDDGELPLEPHPAAAAPA